MAKKPIEIISAFLAGVDGFGKPDIDPAEYTGDAQQLLDRLTSAGYHLRPEGLGDG